MLHNILNLPERPLYCSGKHSSWMKVSKFDITSLCVSSCPLVDSSNWTSKQSSEQWRHHTHIHRKTHPIPPILKNASFYAELLLQDTLNTIKENIGVGFEWILQIIHPEKPKSFLSLHFNRLVRPRAGGETSWSQMCIFVTTKEGK